jgi:hypothetical protein
LSCYLTVASENLGTGVEFTIPSATKVLSQQEEIAMEHINVVMDRSLVPSNSNG